MLSILVRSTKKWYSSFLKSFYVFQKIYFKVKVIKLFKISSDCHKKACRSLKWRAILKIPNLKETYALSVGFKIKPLQKAFSCVKTKTNFCRKPCWNDERSNHSFLSSWWIAFFKHLYSLIMWQYNIQKLTDRKKVRSSQACVSINSCTELCKVQFSLWVSLSQSRCSLETKNFLRGLCPPKSPPEGLRRSSSVNACYTYFSADYVPSWLLCSYYTCSYFSMAWG